MATDVRPYLVPTEDRVVWGPWAYYNGEIWEELRPALEGWDPTTDILVRRTIEVDPARFLEDTGVDIASTVATVSWTSSSSGMTDSVPPVLFSPEGFGACQALLSGERIGGTVVIRTTVSLARPDSARAPGVAWIPGSVFAENEHRVAVEGTLGMFPLYDIDFSHTRLSPTASWHLETSAELMAPFMGTFRLLLNRQDTELMSAVVRGSKDRRQQALCDDLEQGVAMLLLELAMAVRDELSDCPSWPPDSVGDVLQRTLGVASVFEGRAGTTPVADLADLRTRLDGITRAHGHGRAFI